MFVKSFIPRFIILFMLTGCNSTENPVTEDPPDPFVPEGTKILFIGNSLSYYHDMPEVFEQISIASGQTLYVDHNLIGGSSLATHMNDSTSMAKLYEYDWDFVVIQLSCWHADDAYKLESIRPQIDAFNNLIHDNYPQSRTVFYMEPACAIGDWTYSEFDTYFAMQSRAKINSIDFAAGYPDAILAPCGWAWKKVLDAQNILDATNLEFKLHEPDNIHPNGRGAYISACVFYSTIFKDSVDVDYFGEVTEENARLFQQIASEVVLDSLALWQND